jgi:hypothetical protein
MALFCGGPAIYDGGVPKPLRRVNDATLLEQYLRHGVSRPADTTVVLCDASFAAAFQQIAGLGVSVLACPDGSTTFERAMVLLHSDAAHGVDLVHFTYPDVFYEGTVDVPPRVVAGKRIALSATPIQSRFPRLVIDPYTASIRGISTHSSRVPANPTHIFGSNIFGEPELLHRLMRQYLAINATPTLETDFFAWVINESLADAVSLYGDWWQIDSPRDVAMLETHLAARGAHA